MSAPALPPWPAHPKIAMIGAGAIGLWYGGRLARAGEDVHFLLRSDRAAVLEKGIRLVSTEETLQIKAVQGHATTEEIGPCDLVVVATKATANAELSGQLQPLLKETTLLLTLQNGLGSEEFFAAQVGAERVLGGLCFVALNRVAPGEVTCFEPGSVALGEFGRGATDRLRDLAGRFERAGVRATAVENLLLARWRKLVWNIPFNGLSIVAGGIATDRIVGDEALLAETRALMREVIAVAAAQECVIPEEFIERQVAITRPMGAYRPSSLLDYLAGRPVEVETIWGEPLRRARAAGVSTPRLEELTTRLRSLVVGRSR